jgi:hypothetical protein
MNKLEGSHKIKNYLSNTFEEITNNTNNLLKSLYKEHKNKIIEAKIKLLLNICNGEGLDFDKLKVKYLKKSELDNILIETIEKIDDIDESILNKTDIDGIEYYYEVKEKGNVFNSNLEIVGIYKNGNIILN